VPPLDVLIGFATCLKMLRIGPCCMSPRVFSPFYFHGFTRLPINVFSLSLFRLNQEVDPEFVELLSSTPQFFIRSISQAIRTMF
jgi:hypothetical protein